MPLGFVFPLLVVAGVIGFAIGYFKGVQRMVNEDFQRQQNEQSAQEN